MLPFDISGGWSNLFPGGVALLHGLQFGDQHLDMIQQLLVVQQQLVGPRLGLEPGSSAPSKVLTETIAVANAMLCKLMGVEAAAFRASFMAAEAQGAAWCGAGLVAARTGDKRRADWCIGVSILLQQLC